MLLLAWNIGEIRIIEQPPIETYQFFYLLFFYASLKLIKKLRYRNIPFQFIRIA